MADLRKCTPSRRTDVKVKARYQSYRAELAADFHDRCGYCDDRDLYSRMAFEIDHFVPKGMDKDIADNDYSNLVYSCRSCNNAKRRKWPTGDPKTANDGNVGWIDPCSAEYDKQFERDDDGYIIPKTKVGQWMYDNLNLHKSQHQVLWNIEQLEILAEKMTASLELDSIDPKVKALIQTQQLMLKLIKSIWK